jgi:integrase
MGTKNYSGVSRKKWGDELRWVIDFSFLDKGGKRRRFRCIASVQAREAAHAEARRLMMRAAETGTVEEEITSDQATTFETFVDTVFRPVFLPTYRPSTRDRYEALLRQRVLRHFGAKPVRLITSVDLRSFAGELHKEGVQLKGPINLVRTVLRAALEVGVLTELPKLPRLFKSSAKILGTYSDDEFLLMSKSATGWLKIAIDLAALAGARMGEVLVLEVMDVDFVADRIFVRHALSLDIVLTPKGGNQRGVPLSPQLTATLKEAVRGKLPKARLVTDELGRTPSRQDVLRHLKKLQRKLGIPERSFHSLRHYFCSTLIRRGASLEAVRLLAGHGSLSVTGRYVHALGKDLEAAVARLDSTPTR